MSLAQRAATALALAAIVALAGCARGPPPHRARAPPRPDTPAEVAREPSAEVQFEAPREDPMAVHRSDRPLPLAKGAPERIDCLSGKEDLHARVAFEARGGQVVSFAYYSRWRFQTCSISLERDDPLVRWRLTEDGATRVQTPHGSFLFRADAEVYRFEFRDVERMKFCGMYGRMSGAMVVRRRVDPPRCEAHGILDR